MSPTMRKIAKRTATTTVPALLAAACLAATAPQLAMAAAFPAELELSTLNGANGFTIYSTSEFTGLGFSVGAAGDVNADGIDDVAVSGPTHVLFGTDQGFPVNLPVSTLDGTNGFMTLVGREVSGAGDVNGDGIDDIIIGEYFGFDESRSYVLFGSAAGFPAVFDVTTLDGTNGFAVNKYDSLTGDTSTISGAGDVNGDGFDDIVIGDSGYIRMGDWWEFDRPGRAYIVFGTDQGFPALIDADTLDGSNGFIFEGVDWEHMVGMSVSGAGDFNGDGFDDLVIGTRGWSPKPSGQAFMLFGSGQGFPALVLASDLDGSNGFAMFGTGGDTNYNVSDAGDVNGDGIADVMIGEPGAPGPAGEVGAGQSHVLFGSRAAFPAQIDLTVLDGTSGFTISSSTAASYIGLVISSAGDIDGDGFDDLMLGEPFAAPGGRMDAGRVHVVFGDGRGFPAWLDVAALDGTSGFIINGANAGDRVGIDVSGAGDLNGDGIDDLLIGAPTALGETPGGKAHVVFGRPTPDLTVSGACPGSVTIGVTGATPGGAVALLHAAAEGSYTVPSGACTGTILDLASPTLYTTFTADATGAAALTQTLPAAACGRILQTVDATTCAPSNTAPLP